MAFSCAPSPLKHSPKPLNAPFKSISLNMPLLYNGSHKQFYVCLFIWFHPSLAEMQMSFLPCLNFFGSFYQCVLSFGFLSIGKVSVREKPSWLKSTWSFLLLFKMNRIKPSKKADILHYWHPLQWECAHVWLAHGRAIPHHTSLPAQSLGVHSRKLIESTLCSA